MILNAYSIYDRKALVYHSPFFALTDGAACRMLQDTVNDNNTTLARHPNDYVLYRVGHWDDSAGALEPCVPAHVIDAINLVATQPSLPLAAQ